MDCLKKLSPQVGTIPWLLLGELCPSKTKGISSGLTVFIYSIALSLTLTICQYIINFIIIYYQYIQRLTVFIAFISIFAVVKLFPLSLDLLKPPATYGIFALIRFLFILSHAYINICLFVFSSILLLLL